MKTNFNSTDPLLSLQQQEETKQILEQSKKVYATQEECLPLVVENLKKILIEMRKLNDLELSSTLEGINSTMKLQILNASSYSHQVEEELRKDMMKYSKDLFAIEGAKQRLANAEALVKKAQDALDNSGTGEIN